MPTGRNAINITGTAMAVLAGVVLVIAPWFSLMEFLIKLGITIFGIILIFLGLLFSRG